MSKTSILNTYKTLGSKLADIKENSNESEEDSLDQKKKKRVSFFYEQRQPKKKEKKHKSPKNQKDGPSTSRKKETPNNQFIHSSQEPQIQKGNALFTPAAFNFE